MTSETSPFPQNKDQIVDLLRQELGNDAIELYADVARRLVNSADHPLSYIDIVACLVDTFLALDYDEDARETVEIGESILRVLLECNPSLRDDAVTYLKDLYNYY